MRRNRILVFGSGGQVGWELRHKLACLGEVTVCGLPEVDFTKPDTIRTTMRAAAASVVVNAAAYTAVDKAESEPELAWAVNTEAPRVIAEESTRLGSLLVHYSTDYVFDGTKPRAYEESDAPNPLSVYGKTKLAGDEAIQSAGGDYLILRTSWVYGSRGSNFLFTMLRLAQEKSELRIVDDQFGAPTSSECIAQATANILAQLAMPAGGGIGGRSGIYNLTCGGDTSWFGFARSILARSASLFGTPQPTLVPIRTAEYPRPAKRPANSRLSCGKLEDTFGITLPHWEQGLELILETMKEGVWPVPGK